MAGLTSIGYVCVLSLFSMVVVGHKNDRVCFPSPTTGSPETVRVPASSQEMNVGETNQQISDSFATSVKIIHKYTNGDGYELVQIIREAVIIINSGERHVETLNARSFSDANPRELMLEFNGNVVTVAIGKYHQYYNSVTLETKTEWTCERTSVGLGAVITTAFSENGSYRNDQITWLQDFIDIKVANKYQPISQEQDLECFDIVFPSVVADAQERNSGPSATLRVSQMSEEPSYRPHRWRIHHHRRFMLTFSEGERRVLQINYDPSAGVLALKNKNPRNVTILFRDGKFHIAMAKLINMKVGIPGVDNERWSCEEK